MSDNGSQRYKFTGKRESGEEVNFTEHQKSDWTESDTQTNAAATASRAAETGKKHYIDTIIASFTGGGNAAKLAVKNGNETLFTVDVHDQIVIPFAVPLEGIRGNLISAELGAGGSGVDGSVAIIGHSVNIQTT